MLFTPVAAVVGMARIGDYKLGQAIGLGTVGTVYRAKDRKSGQPVAIKILLPQVSKDENIVRRFRREMSVLEKLDHPNIVRYHGDGIHNGQLYYAMELVEFGTVKDELEARGRISWRKACRYGLQICSALQHAHNHSIIHRDLKPSNLFLSGDGQIKLGDFGIARDTASADLTDAGMTVGTYAYMAPEQIRGGLNVSDRTDLYALGCLMYEMIVGRKPFRGNNFAVIFDQHLHSPPPRASDQVQGVPAELDQILLQLMAKNPDDRPFNARYVQGYLQNLLESHPQTGGAPGDDLMVRFPGAVESPGSGRDVSWAVLVGIMLLVAGVISAAVILTNVML
ncbi:MAG TPA: serine/threonine-protein kinase [Pirellulales bacterium]|nr:serine/threonine-protein kinase [Pirellulales bacterium]